MAVQIYALEKEHGLLIGAEQEGGSEGKVRKKCSVISYRRNKLDLGRQPANQEGGMTGIRKRGAGSK